MRNAMPVGMLCIPEKFFRDTGETFDVTFDILDVISVCFDNMDKLFKHLFGTFVILGETINACMGDIDSRHRAGR